MLNIKDRMPVKALHKLEDGMIIAVAALVLIMTLINVLCRYVFLKAIIWSDEFIGFGMLVIGLVGTAACVRDKLNTSLDGLMCKLPRRAQTVVYFLVNALVLALLIYFAVAGFSFLGTVENQKSAMLKWPMAIFYGLIPVCCVLYIIETVLNLITDISSHNCRFIPIEEELAEGEGEQWK